MKEIVVNRCYGGFGISHEAVMLYAKLKGIKVYPYVEKNPFKLRDLDNEPELKEYEPTKHKGEHIFYYTSKTTHNNKTHFSHYDIKRDDKFLVEIVKQLKDKANGECAKLEIVKIPDDVKWEIEEYDGQEWVSEKHRTW